MDTLGNWIDLHPADALFFVYKFSNHDQVVICTRSKPEDCETMHCMCGDPIYGNQDSDENDLGAAVFCPSSKRTYLVQEYSAENENIEACMTMTVQQLKAWAYE
jgi:hypothetical protein